MGLSACRKYSRRTQKAPSQDITGLPAAAGHRHCHLMPDGLFDKGQAVFLVPGTACPPGRRSCLLNEGASSAFCLAATSL